MISLASEFAGKAAMADPLYTITDLGTGTITFSTASGGTVALATGNGLTTASATTPFVSVSAGQGSYVFSTSPDTVVAQSTLPSITSSAPFTLYSGLMNGSGFAVRLRCQYRRRQPEFSERRCILHPTELGRLVVPAGLDHDRP